MMRQYELVERVSNYIREPDEELLNRAYVYAMQKHGNQIRKSGDPYFSHPLEVAAILTDLHLDEDTIAVALLHDTIEDTDATRREIDSLFGERIGILVEGLTKLKKLDLVSKEAKQAENLRRLLLAISDDIRVLLVKLADRLHNMRTLGAMRDDKRVRIAQETMEIYAPLAGRIGMQDLRDELEDLSFRHINPEAYEHISDHLQELQEANADLVDEVTDILEEKLAQAKITAEVHSRQKKAWSIFRKMEAKSLSFEQLSDVYGFRVIVKSVEDCYRTLGLVHTVWKMVPERFKDFVSLPKKNDYQSIHTTVVGPARQRVELQIRTRRMHEIAEYGIAAHTTYKDGEHSLTENRAYVSLRKTIEELAHGNNPEEFLEHTKLELFLDQVFCFTPKGRIIALPKGATSIDFAYAVHTDLGNSCIGAKVNGKITPLVQALQNGDEVEIIRSDAQTPPAAWEGMVKTGKARSAIRRASRTAVRKQYSALGARILERDFEQAGFSYSPAAVSKALPRLAREDLNDLLADVGRGEILSNLVIEAVCDGKSEPPAIPVERRTLPDQETSNGARIPIRGVDADLPIRLSAGGSAVPGEPIVGIIDPGEGITIYPVQSPTLAKFRHDRSRWMDVRWEDATSKRGLFPARIKTLVDNKPGSLARVCDVVARHQGNIQNLAMNATVDGFVELDFDIEVRDVDHLSGIKTEIGEMPIVSQVKRIIG